MSNIVQAYVWQNSTHKGNDLLALVALGEWANDYGLAWQAVDRLTERIRFTDNRPTRALMRRIESSGELLTLEQRGRYHTNLYLVTLPFTGRELSWILQNQLPMKRMSKDSADEIVARILELRGFDIPPNIEIVEQGSLRSPFRRNENLIRESGLPESENLIPESENLIPESENLIPESENLIPESANLSKLSKGGGINSKSTSLPHLRNGQSPQLSDGAARLLEYQGVAPPIAHEIGKRPQITPALVFVTAANLIAECEQSDKLEYGPGLLVHRLRRLPQTATIPKLQVSPLAPKHKNCFGMECCNDPDERFMFIGKERGFDPNSKSVDELLMMMASWESSSQGDFRAG